MAFLLPRNEGAEVDGQYSRMIRMKLDEEGYHEVEILSPFAEDLLDAEESDAKSLFWGLIAGDLVRAAPAPSRKGNLGRVFDLIRQHRLNIDDLSDLAKEISREGQGRSWTKRILAVGRTPGSLQ